MKFFLIFITILLSHVSSANAQSTDIKASVGSYYFSVTGIASPFASIVMSNDSTFLASTVADQKGNFLIHKVLVNDGFSGFCFEVVDVKKLGDSYTCFKIEPLKKDTEKNDVFLPPTLGLSGKKLTPGSTVVASGYSMPSANVYVNISKDIKIQVLTDLNGYYKSEITDLSAGKYSLFATANYEKKESEKPTRTKELEAISNMEVVRQNLLFILIIVFIVLVVFILIIILVYKKLKKWMSGRKNKKQKKVAPEHHSWFLGY